MKNNFSACWIFLLALLLPTTAVWGQKNCDCSTGKHKNDETENRGTYTDYLDKDRLSHPLTTFYRYGENSYYNPNENQAVQLSKLRAMLKSAFDNEVPGFTKRETFRELYEEMYDYLKTFLASYSKQTSSDPDPRSLVTANDYDGTHNENANVAKLAAFIYMTNFDDLGNTLTSAKATELRNLAIKIIKDIGDADFAVVYRPPWGKYYSNHHEIAATLVAYIQAYDYLKAVEPDNADVKECGRYIACYVRAYYRYSRGSAFTGAILRNDNHSLFIAGVMGLASVVLHDMGVDKGNDTWQPDTWAHAALWRSSRTLWNQKTGKKAESRRSASGQDEVWGFGEGPHYYAFCFQVMNPYILALKNAHFDTDLENLDDNNEYKPKHFWTKFYPAETVDDNPWDDTDYQALNEWYCSMVAPDGTATISDDTWGKVRFNGAAIWRRPDLMPYFNNMTSGAGGSSPSGTLFSYELDLRPDVLAAIAERYYDVINFPSDRADLMESGDIVIHSPLLDLRAVSKPQFSRQFYFYLNAESDDASKSYDTKRGHEHDDYTSFLLYGGASDNDETNSNYIGQLLVYEQGFVKDASGTYFKDQTGHNMVFCTKNNDFGVNGDRDYDVLKGIDAVTASDIDLNGSSGVTTATVSGEFKGKNKLEVNRTVEVFYEGGWPTYKITDVITYDGNSTDDQVDDRRYFFMMIGNGFAGDGTYTESGDIHTWSGNCDQPGDITEARMKLVGTFDALYDNNGSELTLTDGVRVGDEWNATLEDYPLKTRIIKGVEDSREVTFVTELRAEYCIPLQSPGPITVKRYNHLNAVKNVTGGLHTKGNVLVAVIDQLDPKYFTLTNPYLNSVYDSIFTNSRSFRFALDTTVTGNGSNCERTTQFDQLMMHDGLFIGLDTIWYVKSSYRLPFLRYVYDKKYHYSGQVVTSTGNDTVCFYLPDVPPAYISEMSEENGLNFSYDTTTQKMTLYLSMAGTYDFAFGPSNKCASSCFFPPDTLDYHFEFKSGNAEHLGHVLDIVPGNGWLDIGKGSKMIICDKAVCNNEDSITLTSCDYAQRAPSTGYKASYFNQENTRLRKSHDIGSGALEGNRNGSGRTMIIIEDGGALVLKNGSRTHVGNGSTILVRPGGTLKIENGAFLEIGSADSVCAGGWGEIIVMDSAYLCIGTTAQIKFNDGKLDTIDRHIFFISQNPKNPAHNGIAPSSNADTSGNCEGFCTLVTTFPQYGITNYRHGWLNVGKLYPWLDVDTLICDRRDVYVNGLYTLNETRYRFEICKYNKNTQSCIGATDTVPMNDTDNYFGGRLQGRINLSDHYSFQRGNHYKITYKVKNDCGQSAELSKVMNIPTGLKAQIDGDTAICGGQGAIKVTAENSLGKFDSLRWEVWEYKPYTFPDSATLIANADTLVVTIDTFWLDSVNVDTVIQDTAWIYHADTLDDDSHFYGKYSRDYWDTTIVTNTADSFSFSDFYFHNGRKYIVRLSLYNQCTRSTDTLFIRIKDGPTVNAGPDKYIGYSTPWSPDPTLDGSVSGHTGSHTWTPTAGLTPSTSLIPKAAPTVTTNYVLSATDADGCKSYDTVQVYVNTVANAGRDTTICHDDSVQVGRASVVGYTYEWSPANLVSDANIAQPYAYSKPNGTAILTLRVYQSGALVGIDQVHIDRDTIDVPGFGHIPGANPYEADFTVSHAPINAYQLDWDFDDGLGSQSNFGTTFTYTFSLPGTIYNVCCSHTNACGLQETCRDCELDMFGNVIPNPHPSVISHLQTEPDLIQVIPNPFTDATMLTYKLDQPFTTAQFELYDVAGQQVKLIQLSDQNGALQLDFSDLSEGVYSYKFIVDGATLKTERLVLAR